MSASDQQQLFAPASSPALGRHLVAATSVRPGEVVLRQQPYAAVLYDDAAATRCDWCFAASDSLQRCARTRFAHYCCRPHQQAAWRAYYRLEAAALLACAPHVPPPSVRLAARVLWRRARELAAGAQEPAATASAAAGGCFDDVEQLLSHWEQLDAARKVQYAQMAALTRQYMWGARSAEQQAEAAAGASDPGAGDDDDDSDPWLPSVRGIAHLLARFGCNNHTICDDELRAIGVGLYPLGALINHACRPNCMQSFEGRGIVFRALRPIPASEQLSIAYVELAATRQERRRQLLQLYCFDIDAAEQAAAGAAQAGGGTCRLQLACQLPACGASPAQQEQLQLICAGSSPPWPQDPADRQLCEMRLLLPCGAGAGIGSAVKLPGGACLLAGLPAAAGEAQAAAAAAGLFADLEGLELAAAAAGDSQGRAGARQQPGPAQAQPAQPAGQLEAVQWGDWAAAAAAAGAAAASSLPSAGASTAELAVSAAGLMLLLWRLLQAADALARRGEAAAAVGAYQQGLAAADGNAGPALGVAARLVPVEDAADEAPQHPAAVQATARPGGGSAGALVPSTSGGGLRLALGLRHVLRVRLDAGLMKAAVDAGAWQTALHAGRRLAPIYLAVYPPVSPNLGLHLALLAKLEHLLEHPAAALRAAEAGAAILQVTHAGSPVLQELLRIGYEASQELAAGAQDAG